MIEDLREPDFSREDDSIRTLQVVDRKDERGSTGVGSLIILIATILIAAVVSGVLIDTVTKLQQQSQKTGQEALWEVSTGVKTVSVSGDRKENGDSSNQLNSSIQVIEVTIRLQSGSRPIDLDDTVITVDNGNRSSELTHASAGSGPADANSTRFVTKALRDPEGDMSSENVMSQGTLVKVYISTDSEALNMDLDPNTQVDIEIVPMYGHPTRVSFTTPPVYTSRYINLK